MENALSMHLLCPICMELLMRPMITSCSHTFCKNCIGCYLVRCKQNNKEPMCPICKRIIIPRELLFERQLESFLEQVRVSTLS